MKRARRCALAAAILVALSHPAAAGGDAANSQAAPAEAANPVAPADAEFDGECVMGLALGKDIKTDCSVNTVYKGKTYCFGNETAKTLFLKKPEEFLLQAQIFYSSKQP